MELLLQSIYLQTFSPQCRGRMLDEGSVSLSSRYAGQSSGVSGGPDRVELRQLRTL